MENCSQKVNKRNKIKPKNELSKTFDNCFIIINLIISQIKSYKNRNLLNC